MRKTKLKEVLAGCCENAAYTEISSGSKGRINEVIIVCVVIGAKKNTKTSVEVLYHK